MNVAGEHTVGEGDRYAPEQLPAKDEVDAAHFHALDLRVGRVVAAEPFPAARKPSLRLRVDFGPVLGVLETSAQVTRYDPEALIGRLVVGAVNLGVRRIAGLESRFLVLGGLHPDGSVALLAPDDELAPGSIVG
jgi:tRNA-binding protein